MPSLSEQATSLKKRINRGETIIGITVPASADKDQLQALFDTHPYDYVWVDGQHSPFNEERLAAFCDLAAEQDMPVLFRIKHTRHTYLIGNMLDLGLAGIEVPQVETQGTVNEGIANFYYAPTGVRSWGGRIRLNWNPGDDHHHYRRWWGETGVLWMQIESVASVTAAQSIAKQGVDCLSFGPMDLTLSLESHPHHPFQTRDDCIQHTVNQLQGTGVQVCYRNGTPDTRQKYIDMGVTVLLEMLPT
jgi:2-keto-3-deoxy-L-rhamnonate aldolase RhmA